MGFDNFLTELETKMKVLPGVESHQKMSPSRRFNPPSQEVLHKAKKSAVMLLLYERNEQVFSTLIQRPQYDGVHSGQIALPGGQHEKEDVSFEATALRETHEEVGIKGIRVIKQLTELYIQPSNFLVYPYVGFIKEQPQFIPQKEEVAEIVEYPIEILREDAIVQNTKVKTVNYGVFEVPSFQIQEKTVWGATAAILSEFKDVLKG